MAADKMTRDKLSNRTMGMDIVQGRFGVFLPIFRFIPKTIGSLTAYKGNQNE